MGGLTEQLFQQIQEKDIPENLPEGILQHFRLIGRWAALRQIHFPKNNAEYEQAVRRLKFEELFIAQLQMALLKVNRQKQSKGFVFKKVGDLFNRFYNEKLPFSLTEAQKRVLKEIRKDHADWQADEPGFTGRCRSAKPLLLY